MLIAHVLFFTFYKHLYFKLFLLFLQYSPFIFISTYLIFAFCLLFEFSASFIRIVLIIKSTIFDLQQHFVFNLLESHLILSRIESYRIEFFVGLNNCKTTDISHLSWFKIIAFLLSRQIFCRAARKF